MQPHPMHQHCTALPHHLLPDGSCEGWQEVQGSCTCSCSRPSLLLLYASLRWPAAGGTCTYSPLLLLLPRASLVGRLPAGWERLVGEMTRRTGPGEVTRMLPRLPERMLMPAAPPSCTWQQSEQSQPC